MKAARTVEPRRIELVDVEPPAPDGRSVLVRVERVGLCGSDIALFTGTHPYSTFPTVQGHEFCGIVVDTGSRGDIAAGERVVVEPLVACGTCYACRRGRRNCCANLLVVGAHLPGALTELVAVRPDSVFRVGGLSADLAALVEPVSIALQGVHRGAVEADETVVVLGAGPIGQAVLVAARARGARVLVSDLLPSRLELARTLGAEQVVDGSRHDVVEATLEWTGGDGAAVVFDATGVPAVVRRAFDAVAPSGRIVLIGISTKDLAVPMNEYTRKELTVLGSRNNAGLFGESIALVQQNADVLDRLVTHRFGLEAVGEALALIMDHPDRTQKVLVTLS